MKKIYILMLGLTTLADGGISIKAAEPQQDHGGHHAHSVAFTDAEKGFLLGYEAVRAALAADDLAGARAAAASIVECPAAVGLTKAPNLDLARVAFTKLSEQAVPLATGRSGYYIVECPMVGSPWVQTTPAVSNPYLGKKMPTCGKIKQ